MTAVWITLAILVWAASGALVGWHLRRLHLRLLTQRARMDVLELHIKAHAAIRKTSTECILQMNERLLQLEARVEKAEKQWGPCH